MAFGTIPATVLPPPPPMAESVEHERVIQRQLGRTSLHVRLVDLASSLAFWIVGVVGFFIVAALYDHVIGLGLMGRMLGLIALAAGSGYFFYAVVWPLLARGINPTYAARTIEEATPSLKNSLINFLLLRQDRSQVKEIVFQAVERKAASDIAAVPVEATVDRSSLIRAGYVLCGVMALFAAYKILSPKDPFQSVARVLAPWAEIARPSRVQITDVQPGNSEVYHGSTQTISALVGGVRAGDPVRLLVSTADGQTVDLPVTMEPAAGGLRYQCVLPPATSGGRQATERTAAPFAGPSPGLQQDLTYRIVAGDAETPNYRLNVIAAPTIVVERLEYQYPAYVKKPGEKVEQQGDIKGLEGTKVTIHAVANQPIKSAWIEFDPSPTGAPERLELSSDGTRATGTLVLQMQRDRETPWHTSYQVRFRNARAQRSEQPILHKIEVIRDLPPEVQILQPQKMRLDVPVNGQTTIEVRALDPDYGLSAVRLEGTAANKPPVKIDLLPAGSGEPPQITVPHVFRPQEHQLAVGDEFKYVAVADDNRVHSLTGQPEPNVARTKEYTLVIVAPQTQQPNQNQQNQNPQNQNDPNQNPQPMGQGQQPMNQTPPNQQNQNQPPQNQQPQNQDPKNPQQPMGGNQQQPPMGGQGQQNDPKNQQPQPSNQQQDGNQQNQPPMGGQSAQQPQNQQPMGGNQQGTPQPSQGNSGGQGTPMAGNSGGQNSGEPQQNNPMQGGNPGERTNQGTAGNQSTGNDTQPAGQQGDPNAGTSGQQTGSGGKPQGKAHDGQAIEEALKELQKRGQQPQEGSSQEQQPNQPPSQPAGQPQSAGKAGNPGQNTPSTGTPAANAADQDAAGQEQKGQGPREKGQPGKANDRVSDEQHGQNKSDQPGEGNKGGRPMGPDPTQQQPKAKAGAGEQREAGAADNGSEGAGAASKDKSGSGEATEANRDRPKEQQPMSDKPMEGEVSAASGSKKQSDSQGQESGDQSGGGKQGAGQSAKQKGNDSAGSQSAADQGAGQAQETGSGDTGNKAGTQKEAAGKTGQAGTKQGKGSTSKSGDEGDAADSKAGQEGQAGKGAPGGKKRAGNNDAASRGGQSADQEGKPGRENGGTGEVPSDPREQELKAADEANLEYSRKATDLALKHLKDQEHNPDPDLLNKLGWTKEDLAEFLRRWDAMQKAAQQTPDGQREMDEALRSLGLRSPNHRQRAGGTTADTQRGLRDGGNRSAPPAAYRELFDAFRKGAARSSP